MRDVVVSLNVEVTDNAPEYALTIRPAVVLEIVEIIDIAPEDAHRIRDAVVVVVNVDVMDDALEDVLKMWNVVVLLDIPLIHNALLDIEVTIDDLWRRIYR